MDYEEDDKSQGENEDPRFDGTDDYRSEYL